LVLAAAHDVANDPDQRRRLQKILFLQLTPLSSSCDADEQVFVLPPYFAVAEITPTVMLPSVLAAAARRLRSRNPLGAGARPVHPILCHRQGVINSERELVGGIVGFR